MNFFPKSNKHPRRAELRFEFFENVDSLSAPRFTIDPHWICFMEKKTESEKLSFHKPTDYSLNEYGHGRQFFDETPASTLLASLEIIFE
ncbi:hypothetical protein OnM2_104002 [Erysiphe neolycopersici]|uniref:Uncharacterized protein n=1 Tax=Erysiphe neolycopersici TaxID=212602 RepID=A0A420H810_9PEZI|nr:hypothetical protein OnM2_104002 [Erysiphe neolycopersici]